MISEIVQLNPDCFVMTKKEAIPFKDGFFHFLLVLSFLYAKVYIVLLPSMLLINLHNSLQ